MLKALAVIVLLDSTGLNPGFTLTPIARPDSVVLAWDAYVSPESIDGFILHSSADSLTVLSDTSKFAAIDTIWSGGKTRHYAILPPKRQYLYITAVDTSSGVKSLPSNCVALDEAETFKRYYKPLKPLLK